MANFKKVFGIFKKNYKLVPLEVFADDPYKTLVSTLMSARTNDNTTLKVSEKLFKAAPTIKNLDEIDIAALTNLIYPVGFYKTKAKHLKALAWQILKKHEGIVPNNREDLMKLPGVGRKTANLVLNRAFGIPAIAVDTHVHKITNMLGWVKTDSPERTEEILNKILPKKYWTDINKLFVSIGRQYRTKIRLEEFLKQNKLI